MQKPIFITAFAVAVATVLFLCGVGAISPAHAQCQPCQAAQANPQTITQLPASQQVQVIKNLTTTTVTQIVTALPVQQQQQLVSNVASQDPDAAAGLLSCLNQNQQKAVITGLPAQAQAQVVTALPQQAQTQFITGLINQAGCVNGVNGGTGVVEGSGAGGQELYTSIQPVLPQIFTSVHSYGFGGLGFGLGLGLGFHGGFHHFH
jgi:hypothetical protein